jgi:hypothetical protein
MERKCLPRVDPCKGLLLRFVDDFLLITREPEVAKKFLTTLEQGVPAYNCRINAAKTSTNFDILPDGSPRVNKSKWLLKSISRVLYEPLGQVVKKELMLQGGVGGGSNK